MAGEFWSREEQFGRLVPLLPRDTRRRVRVAERDYQQQLGRPSRPRAARPRHDGCIPAVRAVGTTERGCSPGSPRPEDTHPVFERRPGGGGGFRGGLDGRALSRFFTIEHGWAPPA